ncbi:hypothetical protein [Pseudomonas sp. COR18]|uniref:hypothetical protein n=1 Tax=Pseudomonas sp. COR18 TaxID=3399680 RepID=UPI003B00FDE9
MSLNIIMASKRFVVGLPNEVMHGEKRVILLPEAVSRLSSDAFDVRVEYGYGSQLGLSDDDYTRAGAILCRQAEAWQQADIVLKYKAPVSEEFRFFRPGLTVAALMHAEGDPELTEALVKAKMSAYAYEFFEDDDGRFPLGVANGTIAGVQAALYGVHYMQSHLGGLGKLPLPKWCGADPVKCVVIGSGNVGRAAAETLIGVGACVTMLCSSEISSAQTKAYFDGLGKNINVQVNSLDVLTRLAPTTDILIGAILISTFDTPAMVSAEIIRSMQPGSVVVDATAGYGGGYMPTFDKMTSLAEPVMVRYGVLHCKIDNLPAAVPLSAVQVANKIYAPHIHRLVEGMRSGQPQSIYTKGLIVNQGVIVHSELSRHVVNWGRFG